MSLSQEERLARRKRNRMAGDALNEDTAVSEAASDAVAESEENKTLMDRFGQDYVDRVKEDGLQDGNKFSRKELASEFRYGRGDASVDDTAAKYQAMVDSGKFKGNNKAQEYLEMHGVNFPGGGIEAPVQGDPVAPEPVDGPITTGPITTGPITIDNGDNEVNLPTPVPTPGGGYGGMTNTTIQDNDFNGVIVGNNNQQNQDNSVTNFGGTTSKFKDAWMNNYFS